MVDTDQNSPDAPLPVGVVAVGDEILEGRILERHGRSISSQLTPLGIGVSWHLSVGDAPGALSSVLRSPPTAVSAIIITGGLGPTADDRTRQELADALDVPLIDDDESWQQIQRYMRSRGVEPSTSNRNQARRPQSAKMLQNRSGSAPGVTLQLKDGTTVFALPGVPSEFEQMFTTHVEPWAREIGGGREPGEILEFMAIPESKLDEWIVDQLGAADLHHICVKGLSQIEVRLPARLSLAAQAARRFGSRFTGLGGIGVETHLVNEAKERGLVLALAESCTGGSISSRITSVPGSSQVFPGGLVCYSNAMKNQLLGVEAGLIDEMGVVSGEVVESMAKRACALTGADLALGVSGIAGPSGGTEEIPVGTVWMGLSYRSITRSHCYMLAGDRGRVRDLATNLALHVLLSTIRGQEPTDWTTP